MKESTVTPPQKLEEMAEKIFIRMLQEIGNEKLRQSYIRSHVLQRPDFILEILCEACTMGIAEAGRLVDNYLEPGGRVKEDRDKTEMLPASLEDRLEQARNEALEECRKTHFTLQNWKDGKDAGLEEAAQIAAVANSHIAEKIRLLKSHP